jgi:hypothetical protein
LRSHPAVVRPGHVIPLGQHLHVFRAADVTTNTITAGQCRSAEEAHIDLFLNGSKVAKI